MLLTKTLNNKVNFLTLQKAKKCQRKRPSGLKHTFLTLFFVKIYSCFIYLVSTLFK
jgi:hypothetical protein